MADMADMTQTERLARERTREQAGLPAGLPAGGGEQPLLIASAMVEQRIRGARKETRAQTRTTQQARTTQQTAAAAGQTGQQAQQGQQGQQGRVAEGRRAMRESDVLELLRDMGARLEQLVSRREFESVDKRVLALEEWRLAQTQREADRLLQIQQQVNTNRTDMDGRIMQWFWSAIMLAGGILAGHLWR